MRWGNHLADASKERKSREFCSAGQWIATGKNESTNHRLFRLLISVYPTLLVLEAHALMLQVQVLPGVEAGAYDAQHAIADLAEARQYWRMKLLE